MLVHATCKRFGQHQCHNSFRWTDSPLIIYPTREMELASIPCATLLPARTLNSLSSCTCITPDDICFANVAMHTLPWSVAMLTGFGCFLCSMHFPDGAEKGTLQIDRTLPTMPLQFACGKGSLQPPFAHKSPASSHAHKVTHAFATAAFAAVL